jgi:hypothetical protein
MAEVTGFHFFRPPFCPLVGYVVAFGRMPAYAVPMRANTNPGQPRQRNRAACRCQPRNFHWAYDAIRPYRVPCGFRQYHSYVFLFWGQSLTKAIKAGFLISL